MSLLDTSDYGIGANFQEQKDELLALESIYSDRPECFKYEVIKEKSQYCITGFIIIHFSELEKPIAVCKKDLSASKTFEVTYLPPVKIHFKFPHAYPSHLPPVFSLDAVFLDNTLTDQIASILNKLWTEYCGMPILFTWAQAIEEEIVKNFTAKGTIDLDNTIQYKRLTEKGSTDSEIFDLVKELKDYQEKATQENFEKGWYDCEVCFNSYSGLDSVRFIPCGHIFCTGCVSAFYHQKLKDSTVKRLECLNDGCDSIASQAQLQRILSPAEFEKYETQLLEGALDLMSDVVKCPRISCQAPVLLETADENSTHSKSVLPGRCSVCNYTFCILCKKTYHGLEKCSMDAELREKLIMQYEDATLEEKEFIHRRFGGKLNFLRELEAMKSAKWIEENSVHCPKCKVAIEKHSGCNKMVCAKCGEAFCWLCRTSLSTSDPYAHFTNTGSACYNRLFEGVVISDDEEDDSGEDDWIGMGHFGSSDTDE